jgi:hypothetical protein
MNQKIFSQFVVHHAWKVLLAKVSFRQQLPEMHLAFKERRRAFQDNGKEQRYLSRATISPRVVKVNRMGRSSMASCNLRRLMECPARLPQKLA